ncbi:MULTISPECIES: hypothetical protein [Pseudomonas]|jgi:hypothetical protein|uniref:Uncharacterized protein n=2 Tax=Pseudomonas TaxID=286 RepID=A0A7X1GHU0_9PSED|nr:MULTISPECIES: hypothetical protein [Pseudomonas]MBC2692712.1 hypothetical protein [Pseudomonas kielensis]MDD1009364.1 hypothetical protein [Pseudomonas shahriarae]
MKSKYKAFVGALVSLLLVILLGWSLAGEFEAATVAEIQSVTADSNCAKQMLQDANRWGQEIRRRDLKSVKKQCVSIDQQSKAFE